MRHVCFGLVGAMVVLCGCEERPVEDGGAAAVASPEMTVVSPEELIDREMESLKEKSTVLDREGERYDDGLAAWRQRRTAQERLQVEIDEYESHIEVLLKAEKVAKEINTGLAGVIERAGLEPKHEVSDEFNRTFIYMETLRDELGRLKKENEALRAKLEQECRMSGGVGPVTDASQSRGVVCASPFL